MLPIPVVDRDKIPTAQAIIYIYSLFHFPKKLGTIGAQRLTALYSSSLLWPAIASGNTSCKAENKN